MCSWLKSQGSRLFIRLGVGRIGKFGVVGIVNTGIDFVLFTLLFYQGGWPLLAANTTSYLVALTNSYLLNKCWTFGDSSRGREALARGGLFIGLNLVGLGLGNLTIWSLSYVLPVLAAKAISVAIYFCWNYFSSSRFVYR